MRNKKIWFIGIIALVLFALVTGVAFARVNGGDASGVLWSVYEGRSNLLARQSTAFYISIYNSNNYPVTIFVNTGSNVVERRLAADALIHLECYRNGRVLNDVRR